MTKTWKLKTNSSNILLVLITLILIKAEWANSKQFLEKSDSNREEEWNENQILYEKGFHKSLGVQYVVGNDKIAQYYFQSSQNNNSKVLEDVTKCLDTFHLTTCLKMLLLNRIDNAIEILKSPDYAKSNLTFMNGLISFKLKKVEKPQVMDTNSDENSDDYDLDQEITHKVLKMFENRWLQLNLFSFYIIDIMPKPGAKIDDFICFNYKIHKGSDSENENNKENSITSEDMDKWQGRKKSKGGGMMSMMMMIPQMLMLGFMPFTLAGLNALVMNAVMVNMMALNGAIMMTIRNYVFGPRSGGNVQYVNYGYSKDRQNQKKRPVLIIHSPAAFVKQPNYNHGKYTNHRVYVTPLYKNSDEKFSNYEFFADRRRNDEKLGKANSFQRRNNHEKNILPNKNERQGNYYNKFRISQRQTFDKIRLQNNQRKTIVLGLRRQLSKRIRKKFS